MRFPLQSLPDTNYWLYALQVNLYGWILEQEYDFKVSGYYLAVVHPEIEKGRLISCPRMDQEMALIVEYEQECGRAKLMLARLLFFCSAGPTDRLSILNPLRANNPAIRVKTPDSFSTKTDKVCFIFRF